MPRNSKQQIYEALTTIPIDQTLVPGVGTVSSVSLTAPSILSVSGSPITTSGTLGLTLATQTANTVFAGPTSGGAATPTFRVLVAADIPALSGYGDVFKVGTPVNNQVGVWTGNGTIEGDADLTFDTATNTLATSLITATTVTASLVGNVTGNVSGNASTVTTNANLTGPITSVGNATSVASQTGTGSTFVMQASPTLTTPNIGTPSAGVLTSCTGLPVSTGVSGLGTGVAAALAVNVGSAGAFVAFNGALGTPTSGTLTNCTFPTLNQSTTGSAATLTTTRTIWGQNFNGSANVSGTLALGVSDLTMTGSIGATGARVTKVWTAALESTAMPTVSGTSLSSTFSPIAGSSSIVTVGTITSGTWNGTDVAVADGGTGRSTSTTAYGLIAAGTTATGAHQTLAAGATTDILVGGGASALPVWTTATGTGAPVRAGSPTFTGTPILATASATSVTFSNGNGAGYEGLISSSTSSPFDILTILSKGGGGGWGGQINFDVSYNGGAAGTVFQIKGTGTTGKANSSFGGSADRSVSNGESVVNIFNGTAPSGTLTNGASFYAASGEMRVMDSAGNSTLLSPHDADTNEHIYFSKNTETGKVLIVETERMWRALNEMLGGGYIHEFTEEPGSTHLPRKDYDENWKLKPKKKL